MASKNGMPEIFSMLMDLVKSNEQCDSLESKIDEIELSDTSDDGDCDENDLDIILEENIIEEKIKGLSIDNKECNDDISNLIGLPKREDSVYDDQLKVIEKALEQNRKLKKMLQSLEFEFLLLKRELDKHVDESSTSSNNKGHLHNVDFYGSFSAPYFKRHGFPCPVNQDQKEKEKIKPKLYEDNDVIASWEEDEIHTLEQSIRDIIVQDYFSTLTDSDNSVKNEQDSDHKMMVINEVSFIRSADLLEVFKKYDENKLDWDRISVNLENPHSGHDCKLMWNLYLKPTIKKDKWTRKEEVALVKSAKNLGFQNWDKIAIDIGSNRTGYQCFSHYQQHLCKITKKWSQEEINYFNSVLQLANSGESINWSRTKYFIDNSDFISLYNKWYKNRCISNEKLRKGKFDMEEDRIILSAVKKGIPLQQIHHYLQLRNSCQIRERYLNCLDVKNRKYGIWTPEEDALLLKLVKEYGEGNWAEMATHFESRSRTQIRQHYDNLKKMIMKNPNVDLEKIKRRKNIHSNHPIKRLKYTKSNGKDLKVISSEAYFIKEKEDLELIRHFVYKKVVFKGRKSVEDSFSDHGEAILSICKVLNFKLSSKQVNSFGANEYRKHLHNFIFGSIQYVNKNKELSTCGNSELGDSISLLPPNLVTVSSLRNILSRLAVEQAASRKKKSLVESTITKTKGTGYKKAVEDWSKRMFILFSAPYILEGLDIELYRNRLKSIGNQDS